jgi:hypothetical protein
MPTKDSPSTPVDEFSSKGGSVREENKEMSVEVKTKDVTVKDGSRNGFLEENTRILGMDGQTDKLKVKYIEEIDFDEPIPQKESYRSRLRIFRGRVSDKPFWKGVLKPIPLICYPAILYSTIVHG